MFYFLPSSLTGGEGGGKSQREQDEEERRDRKNIPFLYEQFSFDQRRDTYFQIRRLHPTIIPVLIYPSRKFCEQYETHLPLDLKTKWLIPQDVTVHRLWSMVREKTFRSFDGQQLLSSIGIYWFVDVDGFTRPLMIHSGKTVDELYTQCHSSDGFLYLIYDVENTMGSDREF